MREQDDISESDFVAACCTVATVLAGNLWGSRRTAGPPVKRSKVATAAAMDCVSAAKHCGFGRTRFRELVAEGIFPEPVTIEGVKRWLAKDLDASLLQIARKRRPRK